MAKENPLKRAARRIQVPSRQNELDAAEDALLVGTTDLVQLEDELRHGIDRGDRLQAARTIAGRFRLASSAENVAQGEKIVDAREQVLNYCAANNIELDDIAEAASNSPALAHLLFTFRVEATKLAISNLRLIVYNFSKYSRQSVETLQDLFTAGYMGLYHAAFMWDPWHGNTNRDIQQDPFNFAGYALRRIDAAMKREIGVTENHHLPDYIVFRIKHLQHSKAQLREELLQNPLAAEVHARTFLYESGNKHPTVSQVHDLLNAIKNDRELRGNFNKRRKSYRRSELMEVILSLDEPISVSHSDGQGGTAHFVSTIGIHADYTQAAPDVMDEVEYVVGLGREFEKVMISLTDQERKVIELRYGLTDGVERTLDEIGKVFGVSGSRIHQVQEKALRKLRHPTRSRGIREYLD